MIHFMPLTADMAQSWDDVVHHSEDGWLFTMYAWQEMITGVREWGLSDHSFAVYDDGRLVAVMPLQMTRWRVLASTGFGSAGPAVASDISGSHRGRLLQATFDHVLEIARDTGAQKLEVSVSPLNEASLNNRWGVNFLVHHGFQDVSSHSWILDLRRSKDEIYANMSRNARRKIREAAKKGYRVREIRGRDEIDTYYEIHCQTYARTAATPHPKEYFLGIYDYFVEPGLTQCWVAENDCGVPVGFTNIAKYKKTACYWTTCCRNEDYENGVYYLMVWHSIEMAIDSGGEWFECSEAFPNAAPGTKLRALNDFKQKFGGQLHRYFKGELTLYGHDGSLFGLIHQVASRERRAATRQLLSRVLGETAASHAASVAKYLYRGGGKAAAVPSYAMRRALRPTIRFIKPYWSSEEKSIGFGRGRVDEGAAKGQFEDALRANLKLGDDPLVVPTGSGRTALHVALRVLKSGAPDKDEVIIPSYGCRGTIDPILENGLVPVFADITESLLPGSNDVIKRLSARSLACLVVHLTGKRMKTDEVIREAERHGAVVIEDHCQNTGGEWRFPTDSPKGALSIYSFGMGKNAMASAGGALVAYDMKRQIEEESKRLRKEPQSFARERFIYHYLQSFGSTTPGEAMARVRLPAEIRHNEYDYVAMNDVDALILVKQLAKLGEIIDLRIRNAGMLVCELAAFPDLFDLQSAEDHIYTKLPVRLRDKDLLGEFVIFMAHRGIELERMYVPLHLRGFGVAYCRGPLPTTERLCPLIVNLPVRPNLTERELRRIADAIRQFGRLHSGSARS